MIFFYPIFLGPCFIKMTSVFFNELTIQKDGQTPDEIVLMDENLKNIYKI